MSPTSTIPAAQMIAEVSQGRRIIHAVTHQSLHVSGRAVWTAAPALNVGRVL
jgi:hypothetical protein